MSYILDALKKNEVEANPEITAEVLVQRPTPTPKPWLQPWMPWAVGAVLVINLVGLGWYLLSDSAATGASTAQLQNNNPALTRPGAQRELVMTPSRSANNRPAYQPNARQPQVAAITPSNQIPSAELPRRIPDRSARPPAPLPAKPRPRPASTTSARKPATAATSKPSRPASSSGGRVLSPEEARQLGLDGEAAESIITPTTNRSATSQPDGPTRQPASSSITIAELPAGAKAAFPDLEFSTHIFADDPSMRAVVVNDKRLTEGEQFGELVLRAVTEEGVVLGYRGHLVRVSIADLWAQE